METIKNIITVDRCDKSAKISVECSQHADEQVSFLSTDKDSRTQPKYFTVHAAQEIGIYQCLGREKEKIASIKLSGHQAAQVEQYEIPLDGPGGAWKLLITLSDGARAGKVRISVAHVPGRRDLCAQLF